MKFWDASALTPLVLADVFSAQARAFAGEDRSMAAWWGSRIECASAIARHEREQRLSAAEAMQARERLLRLAESWNEIAPSEWIRDGAERLLRRHPLRAADALQLAAALLAAQARPQALAFVTFDDRLAAAARSEGFQIQGIR